MMLLTATPLYLKHRLFMPYVICCREERVRKTSQPPRLVEGIIKKMALMMKTVTMVMKTTTPVISVACQVSAEMIGNPLQDRWLGYNAKR